MTNPTEHYEESVLQIARLYYGMYIAGRHWTDVDCSDLIQAGNIAVLEVARRRPEMLPVRAYVKAAIKFGILGEMRKMRHLKKQVYLAHLHEKEVPIVDVLPTRETASERLEQLDDLLYQIRHEFSPVEADALDALVQKCSDVYDLNLSSSPSTDTKDRVRIVTAMDLNDEEMVVYAQVLTGLRRKLPDGYCQPGQSSKERTKKYLDAVLKALGMSSLDFAASNQKSTLINKYRLYRLVRNNYNNKISQLLLDFDSAIPPNAIHFGVKWKEGEINAEGISLLIRRLGSKGVDPREITHQHFRQDKLWSMLVIIFNSSPRLAVEFAFPGTYPEYQEKAMKIHRKYN